MGVLLFLILVALCFGPIGVFVAAFLILVAIFRALHQDSLPPRH